MNLQFKNTIAHQFQRNFLGLLLVIFVTVGATIIIAFQFLEKETISILAQRAENERRDFEVYQERSNLFILQQYESTMKERIHAILKKDRDVIHSYLLDNAFASAKRFVQKNFEEDQSLLFASLYQQKKDGLIGMHVVDRKNPQGLDLPIKFLPDKNVWRGRYQHANHDVLSPKLRLMDDMFVDFSGKSEVVSGIKIQVLKESYYLVYSFSKRALEETLDGVKREQYDIVALQRDKTSRSIADVQKKGLANLVRIQVLLILFLVLFGLGVFFWSSGLAKKIAYPLLDLKQKMEKISKGDFRGKVSAKGTEEIEALAAGMNIMQEEVYQRGERLKEHSKELENKVLARTADMIEKNLELELALGKLTRLQNKMVAQGKLASLGHLVAGIAHEIKNPLNFIINGSSLILDSVEVIEKTAAELTIEGDDLLKKDFLEELRELRVSGGLVEKNGKRIDVIVKTMLLHARSGKDKLVKTNINKFVKSCLDLSFHAMRANFPFDVGINFSASNEYFFNVFPSDLGMAFHNIFDNAFYALHEKLLLNQVGFRPAINIEINKYGSKVKIRVRDNGMGIGKEDRERIFEPFFTTRPTGKGAGLGLSMSYDIICKHGGEITIDSEVGEYCEFVIALDVNLKESK